MMINKPETRAWMLIDVVSEGKEQEKYNRDIYIRISRIKDLLKDLEENFDGSLEEYSRRKTRLQAHLDNELEKLEWAENNYDKALDIAKNAQNYAINNLTKEASLQFLELQIYSYLKGGTNG